jgi:hypothetical protein
VGRPSCRTILSHFPPTESHRSDSSCRGRDMKLLKTLFCGAWLTKHKCGLAKAGRKCICPRVRLPDSANQSQPVLCSESGPDFCDEIITFSLREKIRDINDTHHRKLPVICPQGLSFNRRNLGTSMTCDRRIHLVGRMICVS